MQICFFISFDKPIASDFEAFADNFEKNLDTATANNTFLTAGLVDFDAKLSLWFKSNKTTYEGSRIDGITLTF